MAYQAPTITPQGLVVPVYADIRADLISQYQQIFGQTTYLGTDSADYQDISAFALKIADTIGGLMLAYNSLSPRTASGASLDSIVALNGIIRKSPSFSSCSLTINGTAGTVINNGVAVDVNGYYWDLPSSVIIPGTGVTMVSATCETIGAVQATPGQINSISTPTAGWLSVANAGAAIPGQPVETDGQLRSRQAISVALPSRTLLAGTQAAIAALAGVTRYNIIENPTGATDSYGNPAHSVSCVVEGGTNLAVATAIYNNHGIGCLMNGTTAVTVADALTNFQTSVGFFRPAYVPIYVTMTVHGLANYTTAVPSAIQAALVAYLNSLQIGESVTYSAMYAVASAVMPNLALPQFSIRAVAIGTAASPTGTSDIAMTFNQVASGVAANISVTAV